MPLPASEGSQMPASTVRDWSALLPERIDQIRRQFLLDCAYAELRAKKMPGPPKALRHIIRCAKGMGHPCVSNWISRQDDYAEAKETALFREKQRLARLSSSSTS